MTSHAACPPHPARPEQRPGQLPRAGRGHGALRIQLGAGRVGTAVPGLESEQQPSVAH